MEKTPHSLKITLAALLAANIIFVQTPQIARAASEADALTSRIAAMREKLSTGVDDRATPALVRLLRAISNGATSAESRDGANVAQWDNVSPNPWNNWNNWKNWDDFKNWDNTNLPWNNWGNVNWVNV